MSTLAWFALILGVLIGLVLGIGVGWTARGARRRWVA